MHEKRNDVLNLIDSDKQLRDFVDRCKKSSYLAIDTEFLREKTYYAKLCLVQVATEDEIAIIDPLSISHLEVMADVLTDENIIKIFHACHQDVEILYHETGVVPKPIFDTQIGASLLGKSQQASYSSIVSSYCHVTLPKKDSYTDWSRRPLAKSQLTYAADDVVYLPKIYHDMCALLKDKGRLHWLDDVFDDLSRKEKYEILPCERYRKLRRVNQLTRKQLAAAREFAAWRETRAQKRNIPRKWIVSDEQIVEACKREATTIDELYMVRGLKDSLSAPDARAVVACIKKGLSCPEEKLPKITSKNKNEENVDVIVSLMSALVQLRASENRIAVQTLAPQAELLKLARGHSEDCELAHGWRYHLVGRELQDLLDGKFSLRLDNGNLKIVYDDDLSHNESKASRYPSK